ncbi:MAG TPA: hypothetical protein VHE33_00355 [Acidobacteriaceae bacterium]|nr:hypothetical protein [Acidobacteriaceae bacterium]
MFGIGRKSLPLHIVAASMAQVALTPLENPSEEDLSIRQQAVEAGMDPNRFTLEVIALQTFAMSAAINRERVEGRLKLEKAQPLVHEFLQEVHKRLVETTAYDLLKLGLEPDDAFEVFLARAERYSKPGWGHGNPEDIPGFFAEFCGIADSLVLRQIGWRLTFIRGDLSGDWLKSIKIV